MLNLYVHNEKHALTSYCYMQPSRLHIDIYLQKNRKDYPQNNTINNIPSYSSIVSTNVLRDITVLQITNY